MERRGYLTALWLPVGMLGVLFIRRCSTLTGVSAQRAGVAATIRGQQDEPRAHGARGTAFICERSP